ncbi:MAG: hypothetical protein K9K79_01575 [Desulfohalobiaceae bacterium]|nr:hypothetical protein [Desulfohalobiaceae bacterium]
MQPHLPLAQLDYFYYRHIRNELAAAPKIFHGLSNLDFASWPRPNLKATETRKREAIFHLAKWLWNEAADRAGHPAAWCNRLDWFIRYI